MEYDSDLQNLYIISRGRLVMPKLVPIIVLVRT